MGDWKKWCRLCANLESIEDISVDVKQSILSIFEVMIEDLRNQNLIIFIFVDIIRRSCDM